MESDIATEHTVEKNRKRKRREVRFFLGMTVLCVLGLIVLAFGHPSEYSFMPKCPFYVATGLHCPGCGSLRATHYLLQGDPAASFRHHPLLIPMGLCLLALYVKQICEFRQGRNLVFRGEIYLTCAVLLVFVAFFIVRNIPLNFLEWTRPPKPVKTHLYSIEKDAESTLTFFVSPDPFFHDKRRELP